MGKNEREPTVTKIKNGRGYNVTDKRGNGFRVKGSREKAEAVANAGALRRGARNLVK
jgi:hypothetical protein